MAGEIRAQVAGHVGRQPQGGAAGAAAQFQHMVALCQQFAGAPQRAFIALRIRDSGSRVSARCGPRNGRRCSGSWGGPWAGGADARRRQHTPAPLAPGGQMPAGAFSEGPDPSRAGFGSDSLTSTTSDTPRMMSADAATRSCVTASPRNSAAERRQHRHAQHGGGVGHLQFLERRVPEDVAQARGHRAGSHRIDHAGGIRSVRGLELQEEQHQGDRRGADEVAGGGRGRMREPRPATE